MSSKNEQPEASAVGTPASTKLQEIEQNISDNEANLRAIFENVDGDICLIDTNKRIVTYNHQWAETYRLTTGREVRPGIEVFDFLPPEVKKERYAMLDKVLQGEKHTYEATLDIEGKKKYYRVSVNPILSMGKITGITGYSIDITQSKELAQQLEKEKNISDSLINSLPGVFYLKNAEGHYLRWNTNMETVSGYSADEISHMRPEDFYEGGNKQLIRDFINHVFEAGNAETEIEVTTKQGKKALFYLSGQAITLDGKRCLVGIGLDISEQKRAQEAVVKSEEKYRSLVEQASDAIIISDYDGNFTDVNPATSAMTGYSKEDLLTMNVKQLIEPWDLATTPIRTQELRAGKHVFTPRKILRKDGKMVDVEANCKAFSPISVFIIARDVTEIRKAQNAMAESESRFRGAFEFSAIGMALVSLEGKWLKVNKELCHIVGYSESEILQLTFQDITHPEDLDKDLESLQKCVRGEIDSYRMEKRYFHKSGTLVWVNLNVSVIKDSQGKPSYFVSQIENITQRKKAEEEIIALNESLEKRVAERTKELQDAVDDLDAFNYSVSHDLQTPLRGINTFVQLFLNRHGEQLDTNAKELMKIISGNAVQMTQLVKDMLTFARLGKTTMTVQLVDMNELVQQVINETRLNHPDVNAEIILNPLKPANCDASLIKQVWVNLLSNAIKYSSKKTNPIVEIGMTVNDNTECYYVKDNGVGFDMKHAEDLFRPFERLHSYEEYEGSGVGLAASHRIITKHGGKIWVEAKKNEGAVFYFTLGN